MPSTSDRRNVRRSGTQRVRKVARAPKVEPVTEFSTRTLSEVLPGHGTRRQTVPTHRRTTICGAPKVKDRSGQRGHNLVMGWRDLTLAIAAGTADIDVYEVIIHVNSPEGLHAIAVDVRSPWCDLFRAWLTW